VIKVQRARVAANEEVVSKEEREKFRRLIKKLKGLKGDVGGVSSGKVEVRECVEMGYGGGCIEVSRGKGGLGKWLEECVVSENKRVKDEEEVERMRESGKRMMYEVGQLGLKLAQEFGDVQGLRGVVKVVEKECGKGRVLCVHGGENGLRKSVQRAAFASVGKLWVKEVMDGDKRGACENMMMEGAYGRMKVCVDSTGATDRFKGRHVSAVGMGIRMGLGDCDESVLEYVRRNCEGHRMLWPLRSIDDVARLGDSYEVIEDDGVWPEVKKFREKMYSDMYGMKLGIVQRLRDSGKDEMYSKLIDCGWDVVGDGEELRRVDVVMDEKGKVFVVGFSLGGTSMGSGLSWIILNVITRSVYECQCESEGRQSDSDLSRQCGDDLVGVGREGDSAEEAYEASRSWFSVVGGVVNEKSVVDKFVWEFCGERGFESEESVSIKWDVGVRLGGMFGSGMVEKVKKGEVIGEVVDDVRRFVDGVKGALESAVKECDGDVLLERRMIERVWRLARTAKGKKFEKLEKEFSGYWLMGLPALGVKLLKWEEKRVKRELRMRAGVAVGHVESSQFLGKRLGKLGWKKLKGGDSQLYERISRGVGRALDIEIRREARNLDRGEVRELVNVEEFVKDESVLSVRVERVMKSSGVESDKILKAYSGTIRQCVSEVLLSTEVGVDRYWEGKGRSGVVRDVRKLGYKCSEGEDVHDVQRELREKVKFWLRLRHGVVSEKVEKKGEGRADPKSFASWSGKERKEVDASLRNYLGRIEYKRENRVHRGLLDLINKAGKKSEKSLVDVVEYIVKRGESVRVNLLDVWSGDEWKLVRECGLLVKVKVGEGKVVNGVYKTRAVGGIPFDDALIAYRLDKGSSLAARDRILKGLFQSSTQVC
jgi:hypothetical protein